MISTKQKHGLVDALVWYSCDKFSDPTLQKLRIARVIYNIIVQAIIDLTGPEGVEKDTATQYFSGSLYETHCKMCGIPLDIMDAICSNPDRFMESIASYHQRDSYESPK